MIFEKLNKYYTTCVRKYVVQNTLLLFEHATDWFVSEKIRESLNIHL